LELDAGGASFSFASLAANALSTAWACSAESWLFSGRLISKLEQLEDQEALAG
jgi:hypothetical protein